VNRDRLFTSAGSRQGFQLWS